MFCRGGVLVIPGTCAFFHPEALDKMPIDQVALLSMERRSDEGQHPRKCVRRPGHSEAFVNIRARLKGLQIIPQRLIEGLVLFAIHNQQQPNEILGMRMALRRYLFGRIDETPMHDLVPSLKDALLKARYRAYFLIK